MDLWGRLSNPRQVVETLAEQGSQGQRGPLEAVDGTRNRASEGSAGAGPEEEGRLSNPVQRRLSEHDVDDLVEAHRGGASIDSLTYQFGVHRTTILHHLDRRGVPRPPATRKMTDHTVRQAAVRYRTGESLKVVAAQFGVDARTLAREFDRAGIRTRPRRGWPPRR